jgi:hypothetical protein
MISSDKLAWLFAVASGGGLLLSLWKHYRDRAILQFVISIGWVEVPEEDADEAGDGNFFARAIEIKVTNNGSRPITVERCHCVYSFAGKKNGLREGRSQAGIRKKIGQGDACTGYPKLEHKTLVHVLEVSVTDSNDHEWRVPARVIRRFHRNKQTVQRCPLLNEPGWWFRLRYRARNWREQSS